MWTFSVTLNKSDIINFCCGANLMREIAMTNDEGIEFNGKSMVILDEMMAGNSEDFMCLINDDDEVKVNKFIYRWRNN